MDNEVWVVITNGMSWGKAESFKEALTNALKHSGSAYPVTEMHIYRFSGIVDIGGVDVDGLGSVSYPKTAVMKKLASAKVPPAMLKAFRAFDEEVEEFEQHPATKFYDTFD